MGAVKIQHLSEHLLSSPFGQVHEDDPGVKIGVVSPEADGLLHFLIYCGFHHHTCQASPQICPVQFPDISQHNGIAVQIQSPFHRLRQNLRGKQPPHGADVKASGIHVIGKFLPEIAQLPHLNGAAEFLRHRLEPLLVLRTHPRRQHPDIQIPDLPAVGQQGIQGRRQMAGIPVVRHIYDIDSLFFSFHYGIHFLHYKVILFTILQ